MTIQRVVSVHVISLFAHDSVIYTTISAVCKFVFTLPSSRFDENLPDAPNSPAIITKLAGYFRIRILMNR